MDDDFVVWVGTRGRGMSYAAILQITQLGRLEESLGLDPFNGYQRKRNPNPWKR